MLIAAAQNPTRPDPRANGPAIRALMRQAHAAGARLIHFPEGALSGYPLTDEETRWDDLAEEAAAIADLAGELKLWTVLGSNHRLSAPHRPHNSLYLIDDSGRLAGRHDKRLCSHNETHNYFTPGFEAVVFEADGYRFGCVLCIEVNFPELFIDYARLGVDCVLFSSHSKVPVFGLLAQAHAAANSCWISVSAPAQFAHALPAGIIGPDGAWLAQCTSDAVPDLVVIDMDRAAPQFDIALNKARPWRAISREGSLYRERRVTDPRSDTKTAF